MNSAAETPSAPHDAKMTTNPLQRQRLRDVQGLALNWAGPAVCITLLSLDLSSVWAFTLVTVTALAAIGRPSLHRVPVTLFDIGLITFYFSSTLSAISANDIATSLPQLVLRTLFIILYFAFRISDLPVTILALASAVGAIVHCCEGLAAFVKSYYEWSNLHFSSLVDFRAFVTLTARGERPGNHAAIFVAALVMGIYGLRDYESEWRMPRVIFHALIALAGVCILLSLSRALYLCAAVCIVPALWSYWKSPTTSKRIVFIYLALCSVLLGTGVLFGRPIIRAIADTTFLTGHLSQERSIRGRLLVSRTVLKLISHIGVFGAGVSNYAIQLRRRGLTSPSLLTAHTFNLYLEVAVEQGMVGIAALGAIIAGWITAVFQRVEKSRRQAILCGGAALLMFGLSQTFIVADQGTAALLAALCAITVKQERTYV